MNVNTNLNKLISTYGEDKFYSMIKYPSIMTYHNLGPKGSLLEGHVDNKDFCGVANVYITEKVDGASSLICCSTDASGHVEDYLIGSRTELLYYMNDRAVNKSLGIVSNLRPYAEQVRAITDSRDCEYMLRPNCLYVFMGEHYGLTVNGYKQYTSNQTAGWRVFDIVEIPMAMAETVLDMDIAQISVWREGGNQPFVTVDVLQQLCKMFVLETVPYICVTNGDNIPLSLQEVWNWMQQYEKSNACLDDGGLRHAEGVVVRTFDRRLIRKMRFEDYEKTKRLGLIQ